MRYPACWLVGMVALPACLVDVPDLRKAPDPGALGVEVSAPTGRKYRIDATEVTNAQYRAWLDALGGKLPTQRAECAGNTDLVPAREDWPVAADLADHPVTFVDWCDAATYCTDHGKRLCGGADGGAYDVDDGAKAAASEWFNACTGGGKKPFPYGPTFDEKKCNGAGFGGLASISVREPKTCEGGFPGLFGMNGNAREWDDACVSDEPNAGCAFRGGGFKSNAPSEDQSMPGDLGCEIVWLLERNGSDELTGFRCCGEP